MSQDLPAGQTVQLVWPATAYVPLEQTCCMACVVEGQARPAGQIEQLEELPVEKVPCAQGIVRDVVVVGQ